MAQKKTRSRASAKSKKAAGRGSAETERYEKALESLERALRALYKGEAQKARAQLEQLQENYPAETELMDRVRSYLRVCAQKLEPQRRPKTTEELVTYGIMHHNDGDPQQAVKYLSKALEAEPKNAHIQYCLAAAHARAGSAEAAASQLRQAIQNDPTVRIRAKSDADFDAVRDKEDMASVLSGA